MELAWRIVCRWPRGWPGLAAEGVAGVAGGGGVVEVVADADGRLSIGLSMAVARGGACLLLTPATGCERPGQKGREK